MQRQQFLPAIQRVGNFAPVGDTAVIPCDTVSGASEVPFPELPTDSFATDVQIFNAGSVTAFIAFGGEDVEAAVPTAGNPANGTPIPAGTVMVFDKGQSTHMAGITASSTATLYVTQGAGS